MFDELSNDAIALTIACAVAMGRLFGECARARRYGPGGKRTRRREGGVGDAWSEAREREAFERRGRAPGGKRLLAQAAALVVIGGSVVFAALEVSMPKRARMARRDYASALDRANSALERKVSVRVWGDFEGTEGVVREVSDRLRDVAVNFEVVVPGSSTCAGGRREPWSATALTASDEFVEEWIDEESCDGAENSRYDFVLLAGNVSNADLVLGRRRAAWLRFNSKMPATRRADELEARLRTFVAHFSSASERASVSPFLTTSDGVLLASFSLVNAEPREGYAFTWDFERDVEQPRLGALPNALRRVIDLRIESQVLRHSTSRIRPTWSAKHDGFVVKSEQLPFFIDPDWPIDTSITYTPVDGRPLQFVVYVPSAAECPLYFLDENGEATDQNAYLVEGWGGVVVFNPRGCAVVPGESERRLSEDEISNVVNVFVRQLRIHLGLRERPQNIDATVLPPKLTGFATWEVDSLVHTRLVSDSSSAISTLKSLDEVISSIDDIAVPEFIVNEMSRSFGALDRATRLSEISRYDEALVNAQVAHAAAEAAFFDPFSLGGLESFSFESKMASVIPLLLPCVFPLLLQIIREARHFQVRRRCASEARARKAKAS